MTVLFNSTNHRGLLLINRLERLNSVCTNRLNAQDYAQSRGDIQALQGELRNAIHRLRFLEMAVLGLTHGELEEAASIGKKLTGYL
jgi:hypothetical protein